MHFYKEKVFCHDSVFLCSYFVCVYRAVVSVMGVHNTEVKEKSTTFSTLQMNINKHL